MTREVETITPDTTLAQAAHVMVSRNLKRLPMVDGDGVLVGMVSRLDILRTCSEAYPQPAEAPPPHTGRTVGEIMRTDFPTLERNASLPEVLDAVVSTGLNRALVLDSQRHVLGVITDAELIRRLSPEDRPGLVRVLMSRMPFSSLPPDERRGLELARGTTAEQLMVPDIPTVPQDAPVAEAIRVMLGQRRKVLPVVDEAGRFLGAVDRADLLRMIVELEESL
ncbi:MAG: CBS domain-containing protein [Chloroflexota bacterium]